MKNPYAGVKNPYADMENVYEDAKVNLQASDYAKEQSQQNMANIMNSMQGAAGSSGVAGLAQVLANQGVQQAQQASVSIGQQEQANELRARGEAGRLQQLDVEGEQKRDLAEREGERLVEAFDIKKVDDDIVNYKETIINDMIGRGIDKETAEQMAETLAEMVAKNAGKKNTPKITEQGLLELENIQKNLLTKDRKLQASGGIARMLGE